MEQSAIRRYWASEVPPSAQEKKMAQTRARPPKTAFKKIAQSPPYKAGHSLRSYQVQLCRPAAPKREYRRPLASCMLASAV